MQMKILLQLQQRRFAVFVKIFPCTPKDISKTESIESI